MKNLLKGLMVSALLSCLAIAHASPPVPGQLQLKQKDGASFSARLKGDEHFSWAETADGYVSVKNRSSGNFEYAVLHNGQVVPSGIKTTTVQPATTQSATIPLLKASNAAFRSYVKSRQTQSSGSSAAPGVTAQSASVASAQAPYHGTRSMWNWLGAPRSSVPLLIVMIEFNDQQFRSPVATWAPKIFGEAPGQLNAFWKAVSNSKFKVTPAQETQGTANDGIMKVRLSVNHPNQGSGPELQMALTQLDSFINYASFDLNGDQILSRDELQIMFIYSGGEASSGSSLPSVWGHASGFWNVFYDGVDLQNSYSAIGERQFSPPNDNDATIGIIAHELGHSAFGLPDLYDADGSSGGIDGYCLMSGGSWGTGPGQLAGASPAAPAAWVRYRLGFSDVSTVVPGTPLAQTLKPQTRQGRITLIPTEVPYEYYLVENRYPEGTDISLANSSPDLNTTGYGGAMIWHIDESWSTNSSDATRLVDYVNETTQNLAFWPFPSLNALTSSSNPNSNDNGGTATGVTVSGITRLADADHSVSFTAEKRQASVFPALHFRGTSNNWAATPMTLVEPGVWEIEQDFPIGSVNARYKFDVSSNWTAAYGDTNRDGILELGGADIPVTPSKYRIRVRERNLTHEKYKINVPPVARAGADQVVTVNQVVQLDSTASTDSDGTIIDHRWDNGLYGSRPTISYSTVGVRTIVLQVTDNDGASSTDDIIIDVRAGGQNQLPTARIVAVGSVQAGQAVTFDGRTSSDPDGSIASYSWTINGAATTLSGATPSHTFAAAGTYAVGLQVTDNLGAQSTLTSVNVTVGPAGFSKVYPQVYYRGTSNGWAANTVMTLVANNLWSTTVAIPTTGTQAFKFDIYGNWTLSFGDNNADGLAEQSGGNITLPAGGGSYVITFNDSTRRYTMVKQTGGNQAPVAVVPATQTITGAATATLNGSASNDPDGSITAYQWTQVSGPTVSISNATAATASVVLPTVSTTTSYRFRLTVTDNAGATAFAEQVITQNPVQACTSTYARMNLRGTSNGWGSTAMTLSADCFWQTTAVFGSTTSERFKFDVNGDWGTNFGDTNRDGIAEAAGADIPVTLGAGTYLVRFNDGSKRYTLVKQ